MHAPVVWSQEPCPPHVPSFVFGQTARSQVAPTNPGSHSHANVALVHTPCPEHLETQRRLLQAFPKNPARHLH